MTKTKEECVGKRKRVNEKRADEERLNWNGMNVTSSSQCLVFVALCFDFCVSFVEVAIFFDMSSLPDVLFDCLANFGEFTCIGSNSSRSLVHSLRESYLRLYRVSKTFQ